MPIRKFHDVSEMEDALWYERGDRALYPAIARTWDFAERTCHRRFPPGVHKHRTIEDADAQRERWDDENLQMFQARRKKP